MLMWFTNGWLRLGSKKRAQLSDDAAADKEKNADDRPYPTMKKAKKKEVAPPADTGPWLLLQDPEGRFYWWNDATGQWTYQLYSTPQQQALGYPHLQHHHQHVAPMQQQVSYSQQHTAHLTHHHHYNNPNHGGLLHGGGGGSPPLGPVSPPHHMWPQQHQAWGLLSPSAHGAAGHGAPAAFGLGWDLSSDEEEEEEEEEEAWAAEKKAGGTWDKFFDGRGLPVWIHSKTGSRTSVNPATA